MGAKPALSTVEGAKDYISKIKYISKCKIYRAIERAALALRSLGEGGNQSIFDF